MEAFLPMSKLSSAGLLVLAATLVLGCGGTSTVTQSPAAVSPAGSPGVAIEGLEWVLKQQSNGSAMADVPSGTLASLLLDQADASGTGGCNQFTTTYTLTGSALTFGPLLTTKAACPDATSSVETAY